MVSADSADIVRSIRVGIAGWSYPDWRGVLYPRAARRGAEDLRLVAGLFDCVEINSTFYREPEARLAEAWLRAVADRPGFVFTAKVPRGLTHERDVDAAAVREGGRRTVDGLRPLVEAGRLEVLLAQFPPWFADTPGGRERIQRIVEALAPVQVAVEVRNASFLQRSAAQRQSRRPFVRFLEETGAGFVNVDLPPGPGALPPTVINTSPVGYVRFHGRNSNAWFDRAATRDQKYDYLYAENELREWSERILELAGRVLATYVVTNNHFRGQAPANAFELLHLLGREVPELPPALVAAYPRLSRIAGARSTQPAPEGGRP